jgi:hypothetical protein
MKTLFALASVLATTLAVASVAFGSGRPQGYTIITDTLGGNGSAKTMPDALERYVANHARLATATQGFRFITDTLGGRGGIAVSARPSEARFSWSAAGVGAAGAAGALFALLGTALLVVRRRTRVAV